MSKPKENPTGMNPLSYHFRLNIFVVSLSCGRTSLTTQIKHVQCSKPYCLNYVSVPFCNQLNYNERSVLTK